MLSLFFPSEYDSNVFYRNIVLKKVSFKDVVVETPQGVPYEGKRIATEKICAVSILRAGETMENALCEVLKDLRIGKILIQTNLETGEPEVRNENILYFHDHILMLFIL